MSKRPIARTRIVALAGAIAAIGVAVLATVALPASAGKPTGGGTTTGTTMTVRLVCPPGNYEKVTSIALFDSKDNVLAPIGTLECGVGTLSTYPGPAVGPESRTVTVTRMPTKVGYQGEWRCADESRPVGSALGGPVTIALGPTYFGLTRNSPTVVPCQPKDANGVGYASGLQVSW